MGGAAVVISNMSWFSGHAACDVVSIRATQVVSQNVQCCVLHLDTGVYAAGL